jgi:hypothetical protein
LLIYIYYNELAIKIILADKVVNEMDYLYFPDNRLEYIPGAISFVLVIIIAIFAIRFLQRYSERELRKADEIEAKMKEHEKKNSPTK